MVFGRICMAHGSIASLCTGRISMVPALAAAVPAVGLDGADHHLDSEHYPDLLRLAFAHAWSSVVGSWLDYAAGIRIRGNGRCNYHVSPVHTTGSNPMLNGLGALCERGLRTCVT
jgi:hypothetical protein